MLLSVALAPGVVGLIGVVVGDGVGSLAGVAHCVSWWFSDVEGEGEGDGSTAEAIHDEWSLIPGEVILSVGVLSFCSRCCRCFWMATAAA